MLTSVSVSDLSVYPITEYLHSPPLDDDIALIKRDILEIGIVHIRLFCASKLVTSSACRWDETRM